ncbi:hypothetical protein ABE28_018910 [Peribacillus muralis]|uniref:Peptidase M41 FtsH extracellular domain-containing protein n=1 Tax=Peribacillus muralis TaxID=264697 RepID=A0A1B3XTC6_9BACI|nr:ATP-dependent metallopeptidase FtsH/Yme1/Tma family protein [Peribacillus muralis]AOH56443.1 hypothetical protein ABE28_018910 [Peribacillus muralis]
MKAIFRRKFFYVSIVIVLVVVGFAFNHYDRAEKKETMTDAEFYSALGAGKVTSLKLEPKKSVYEISGRLKGQGEDHSFSVTVPNSEFALNTINRAAEEHNIKQVVVIPSDTEVSEWVTVLTTTLPFILLLIMAFVIFLMALVIKRWNRPRY